MAKKASLLLGLWLFLGVLLAGCKENVAAAFPMWEVAPVERISNGEVDLRFVSVDDAPAAMGEGLVVRDDAANNGDATVFYGEGHKVEYFYEDGWYVVYEQPAILVTCMISAGGVVNRSYAVPRDTFNRAGQYRIYIPDLGYCPFEIPEPIE